MNAITKFKAASDHDFRIAHVGAAEVSALFGENPWLTQFELWHRKKGNIATPDLTGNERIEAGIRLEPVIIKWACDKWGYIKHPTPQRLTNGKGLGGHPDQQVGDGRGPGILEVKTADWLQAKGWGDEPPLHYQLQAMTYMGLAGVDWADLVMLVGGNELRRFQIAFRPKLFSEIERRVTAFWASIVADTPPPADYSRDLDPIKELRGLGNGETVDLSGDNLAAIAAAEYLAASEAEKGAKARKEAAQAELFDKIGAASFAQLSGFCVNMTNVSAIPDREAEAGEIIKGRKGYRRLTVKEQK